MLGTSLKGLEKISIPGPEKENVSMSPKRGACLNPAVPVIGMPAALATEEQTDETKNKHDSSRARFIIPRLTLRQFRPNPARLKTATPSNENSSVPGSGRGCAPKASESILL